MNSGISSLLAISQQSLQYMISEITYICKHLKPRAPGSAGERETAQYMADKLKKECGCSDVNVESFREHPSAFYSYFYVSMILDLLSLIGFFIHPWAGVAFGCAAMLLFVLHFIMYKQIIDRFFPSQTGTNVTARRPCAKEVRRRIFFNGHIDASWEFPLNYRFGGVVFEIPGVMSTIGVLWYIIISICAICNAGAWTETAGIIGLVFAPFFIILGFTYNPKHVVDGANDDLSGCYIGIALLRELERQNITLEHTEVGVILTGSEEAGLRGAKAWCKTHMDDYQDVPTFIICFDTIHDPHHLMVNGRDLNGTVPADPALCDLFLQAARDADIPCRIGWVPPFGGATDSAAFTQGGFRSVGITGLNHKLEDYYHTRRDSYDNMNDEGLENCYKATVRTLELIDNGALERC